MFQVKNFTSIVAGAINQIRAMTTRLTDFNVGSVNRTIIEGVAVEIDELYQQMMNGLVEGIPTALFLAFDFGRLPPAEAAGRVTFTIPAGLGVPTPIAAGTAISDASGQKTYVTIEDATIAISATTASAGVRATAPGPAFNVGIGELNTIAVPTGGMTVSNASAISTGRDLESEAARKLRFLAFVGALSRGPIQSIKFGAESAALTDAGGSVTERVVLAKVVELFRVSNANPLGYINVYLWNGATGASGDLVTKAQAIIDGYTDDDGNKVPGWKGAGVVVVVSAVTTTTVAVHLNIKTTTGSISAAQSSALSAALSAYLESVDIGGKVYLTGLEASAFKVAGVLDAHLTSPGSDVTLTAAQKAIPGAFTYTAV